MFLLVPSIFAEPEQLDQPTCRPPGGLSRPGGKRTNGSPLPDCVGGTNPSPSGIFTFSFERIEGKVTIRWEGVEQRPTLEQIKELDQLRWEVIALV